MICETGINDMPGWSSCEGTYNYRVYRLWRSMIERVFSESYLERNPCYWNCDICPDWLILSKFAQDIQELPGYTEWRDNPDRNIALDKDIRGNGQKYYCKENCSFVSGEINSAEGGRNGTKAIICISPEGVETYYDSLTECANARNFTKAAISQCLTGKRKTNFGCRFRYA